MLNLGTNTRLLCGTALLTLMASGVLAQPLSGTTTGTTGAECNLSGGTLPEGCEAPNATTAVTMPAGENTEMLAGPPPALGGAGFQIVIDGQPAAGDPDIEDITRQTDLALEKADIRVSFDSLGARTRLDLQRSEADRPLRPGETVTVTSRLNYPAYVSRGETVSYTHLTLPTKRIV